MCRYLFYNLMIDLYASCFLEEYLHHNECMILLVLYNKKFYII